MIKIKNPYIVSQLPNEYQQVEYIESTETQYIDSGFVPTQNTKVECEVAVTDTRTSTDIWPAFYGAQNLANGSDKRSFVFSYTPSTKKLSGSFAYTIGQKYKLKQSVADGYCINNVKYADYAWVNTPTVSMGIFTRKSANNGFETCMQGISRLYSMQVYDSNTLVRNYIPCYRKADSVIGLYDLVNNVFYINGGTGTFLKGNDVTGILQIYSLLAKGKSIPADYQEVEYIESNGTQYIDSGFKPTQDSSIEMDIQFTEVSSSKNQCLYCSRGTTTEDRTFTAFLIGTNFRADYNIVQNTISTLTINASTKYKIYANKNKFYVNNNLLHTSTTATFKSGMSWYLFASTLNETTANLGNYASARLYRAKMYDNDVLVRDFVPCYRKSDTVIGLYDLVNDVFYINQGTGTLLKGNDVNTTKSITKVIINEKIVFGKIDVSITAENIAEYFNVTNTSYYFALSGSTFTSNNKGNHNTTAKTTLTAKRDIENISFNYSVSSESNYDKLFISVANVTKVNNISGTSSSSLNNLNLKAGESIIMQYSKDGSSNSGNDVGVVSNIKCSVDA